MGSLNRFIENELEKRKNDYKSSPTYILEHYNNERQNIVSYNGRQLLEMLQNADDASEQTDHKKVFIKLTENELIIANNGEPFTEDGFRSILYISVSSKTLKQNKIGHKGLGFRSILSWADEVIINSGGTIVSFSENNAVEFLKELLDEAPEIRHFLTAKSDVEYPIATLRIPKLLRDDGALLKNYDTVLTIKLKESVVKDVQKQIQSVINKETLIFLNNIQEIEIDSPQQKIVYKKEFLNSTKSVVTVKSTDVNTSSFEYKTWNIKSKKGTYKEKNYELAIAWNDLLNDNENVLFSYFKTEAKFPFPALVHGTFELTPDRKHLENDLSGHNRFLVNQLADLLIESSLEIASKSEKANYLPLKLLNIDFQNLDTVITVFNFKETLINKIKISSVIPNVNGVYIRHEKKPVYYDYPIADFLRGEDVEDLMPISEDPDVVKFIRSLQTYCFHISTFVSIISKRTNTIDVNNLSKLYFHLLQYESYVQSERASDFDCKKLTPFIVDAEKSVIPWEASIFLQPNNDNTFKLPKFLNIRFVNPEIIDRLLQLFKLTDQTALIPKLKPFNVKVYSFTQITETLLKYFNDKSPLATDDIIQLHTYLFRLYKREIKSTTSVIPTPVQTAGVITINGKIKTAREVYFGKTYGNELTERLYSFDKSRLLSSPEKFNLQNENQELLKRYFAWLGVVELPRYATKLRSITKQDAYLEYILRSYKYPLSKWGWTFKSYTELYEWLPWNLTLKVGEFDLLEKLVTLNKIHVLFEWIKKDKNLKETLEKDTEILIESKISFVRHTDRSLNRDDLLSYTKWRFSTSQILPILSSKSFATPSICCLSKTITSDFSPFVEQPKIDISVFAQKLELQESTIENFLIYIGAHREISSFSLSALYDMVYSLPNSDRDGKVSRKIYREIISNFNESKIDISHPSYKRFITDGKIYCLKGNEFNYFKVTESYYLPSKTFGHNVLKLFPLVTIDSKQGPQKVERLFGIKRLKDISFSIIGDPVLNILNDEFTNEIERFKALVYVLRKDKDTKHEIANRLKRLKIFLSEELKTDFTHSGKTIEFQLEGYEYISKSRSQFYISVPSETDSTIQLREENKFCQSIAEIFSTIIETEEYTDFIHDLYSKVEYAREARLLSFIQRDDNLDIQDAKKTLNIVDDVRMLFWRAFSISSGKNIKAEIRSEEELSSYLKKKLKLELNIIDTISAADFINELYQVANQEIIYSLFVDFQVDLKVFSRHFSGLTFSELFKNKVEDYKIAYRNNFAFNAYNDLLKKQTAQKEKFFDLIDQYNTLSYVEEDGFITNIELYFNKILKAETAIELREKCADFSFEHKMKNAIEEINLKGTHIPGELIEKKSFQSLLVFNEQNLLIEQIRQYNFENQNTPTGSSSNQLTVRGNTIDYDSYESLAEKVLNGLDISRLKLQHSRTITVEENANNEKKKPLKNKNRNVRFNTKNEEQIGFIAELICFHKLVSKHGEENVNWISENAFRAYPAKFLTGEAGKGYDLELKDNGKVRFIEIKGSSNISGGIYFSKQEIKKALEFPDRYDLIVVEDPLCETPVIRHIKTPFKFKKDQSLFSNERLRVFNDNYVIKFNWDE